MFGHEVLVPDECRMIGEEVWQADGGCRCGSGCHFDFVAVEKRSDVILIWGWVNAVEMCQGGSHDRCGWCRRRHVGWRRMMMPIRLRMILLMRRSRSVAGRVGSRGCGYRSWRRCQTVGGRRLGRGSSNGRRWIELGVLAFAVPPQVNFALEGASAVVASERLVAGVLPGVCDQVGRLAEGFPADRALVRLFACNYKQRTFSQ